MSTLGRRADLSSWVSVISCKVSCRCALDLRRRIRCANQGNETMCPRTDATVTAACVDGGVSLQAREKTFSLLREAGVTSKRTDRKHGSNCARASQNQFSPAQTKDCCMHQAQNADAFKKYLRSTKEECNSCLSYQNSAMVSLQLSCSWFS